MCVLSVLQKLLNTIQYLGVNATQCLKESKAGEKAIEKLSLCNKYTKIDFIIQTDKPLAGFWKDPQILKLFM